MPTPLDKETIEKHAGAGKTVSEIAKILGASYSGVFNFCKAHNIEVRKAGKLSVETVTHDIRGGLSQNAIGGKYGIAPSSVSTFIKKNGLKDLYVQMKEARPKRVRGVSTYPKSAAQEKAENEANRSPWMPR